MRAREGLLLELLTDDGESLRGEAAPLPGFSRETLEDAQNSLKRLAEAYVEYVEDSSTENLEDAPPSVAFALESALAEVQDTGDAGFSRVPSGDSLALCGLLSGDREEILSDAARMRESGYAAVKLKVGRLTVGEDAALVVEVRAALGADVELRLDANRAWSFAEAEHFAGYIKSANVEFVEEPLSKPERLREFSEKTGLPVALDESLTEPLSPADRSSVDRSFARAFVLKPTLLGYSRALELAAVARDVGAKVVISSSYESGIGTLALARLAATHGDGAAGLDTYRRFAEDVISPTLDLAEPFVSLRELFDLRREVDYGRLERLS